MAEPEKKTEPEETKKRKRLNDFPPVLLEVSDDTLPHSQSGIGELADALAADSHMRSASGRQQITREARGETKGRAKRFRVLRQDGEVTVTGGEQRAGKVDNSEKVEGENFAGNIYPVNSRLCGRLQKLGHVRNEAPSIDALTEDPLLSIKLVHGTADRQTDRRGGLVLARLPVFPCFPPDDSSQLLSSDIMTSPLM
ncbi:unnamed protein product [Pleuronectes platessa]|uniref:Uncharacterized protein n=1 Tax=Pleuronectes platessa TaxID=8262 RepID=A0A9N7UMX8_PLEPL|nr:unnamed protein product [Pleuronectes platessa]